jgi:prevent-host-death family protein
MTTKLIGIKEFRQNISSYVRKAQKGKTRIIVTSRNIPLFEIKPFSEDIELLSFFNEIMKGKEDVKKGRVHTQEEVLARFS